MKRFEDKVVLVSGAASGIGKASVERLAAEGAQLACVDVQSEAVELTAKEARGAGAKAIALTCDVADPAAIQATIDQTISEFGKLDSLCNIAGILHFDHTHELALEKWNRILLVNLTGTFLMTQAALPHLLANGGGNIVNMSSSSALAGHPWMAAYASSKGGVLALTYTLAIEYGKQGLRVNALCPGGVSTPIHEGFELPEGADGKLLQRIMPLDEFRGPETAASVIAFLASDDAAHINGEHIRVDGGTLS